MEKTYCKKCDAEVRSKVKTCYDCGLEKIKSKKKSPVVAALLSCVVPGLGQVYGGELYRGLALLAALGFSLCLIVLIIGIFTFFATWIFAVIDAYRMVKRQKLKIQEKMNEASV